MTTRPHRSAPVTYRQAMDALHDAYLTLLNILQLPLEPNTREQLELLLDRLAVMVVRDDGADDEMMTNAYHDLPTPRTTLRVRYVSLLVWCKGGCQHQAPADLQALIDAGKGDVPLLHLKFRCSNCGSDRTDFVVTSRDNPQPW